MDAQTKDPMTVQGDVAIVYAFDPATVYDVFLEKRSAASAEVQVVNAIRDGYRSAVAGWSIADISSARRANLGDSVRAHIQLKLGKLATVKQVFIRDIRVPAAIAHRVDQAVADLHAGATAAGDRFDAGARADHPRAGERRDQPADVVVVCVQSEDAGS
jgi:regulator of protease activity HflC (stomatin/prohibitin superfamily)